MGTNDTTPWGEHIEANNVYHDMWFVNIYPMWAWVSSVILLFAVPPLGAFFLTWMGIDCIHHAEDDVEMAL